jgi:hypothetical protein
MANTEVLKATEAVTLAVAKEIAWKFYDAETDAVYCTMDEAVAADIVAMDLLGMIAKPYGAADEVIAAYKEFRDLTKAGIKARK